MFSLPYRMFQLLMDVETLLLTPTTPHLRILTAELYPLTLSLFLSQSRLSSLWDAAVVSQPDLLVETLGPHAPITTVLPYTYSTPYPMLAFICNILYIIATDIKLS